ncbi:hypothetical protein LCGC14_2207750, partial [marine sediment metagenome]
GIFATSGDWQPLVISKTGTNLDFSIFEYDNTTGWALNATLSSESIIPSITGQIFKLFDIHGDGISEIIRVSTGQIDVIYHNGTEWKIITNVTNLPGFEYYSFDIAYEGSTTNTLLAINQEDMSDNSYLYLYRFETNYSLTKIAESDSPTNFIPTSIKIVNYFSANDRKAILVGGLIANSYYSQLVEYNFNFEIVSILEDALLGKISVLEYDILNNLNSIILGVERVTIGKMDAVILLRRTTGTEEWISFELSGWDDTKFQVLDMLTIQENNIRKLIVASKTGLYQTIVQDITDLSTITSPIFYTTVSYSKTDLQQFYDNNILSIILEDGKSPLYSISKIYYKTSGSNQWNSLSIDNYRGWRNEIRIDVSSIWSTLTSLKIAYSFESF